MNITLKKQLLGLEIWNSVLVLALPTWGPEFKSHGKKRRKIPEILRLASLAYALTNRPYLK